MRDGIAEVLLKASKLKTEKERITFLQNSNKTCEPLATVFRLMFVWEKTSGDVNQSSQFKHG